MHFMEYFHKQLLSLVHIILSAFYFTKVLVYRVFCGLLKWALTSGEEDPGPKGKNGAKAT